MPNAMSQVLITVLLFVSLATISSTNALAATNINFELNGNFSTTQQTIVKKWLRQGLSATEQTVAPLPFSALNFKVVKHHSNNHPVPWGQIIRGQPNTVKLHVAPLASLQDLSNDWTLYHELSHLYLPYMEHSSFWLGEGFASYMQYIIMYQAGWLDRNQFIDSIKAGFERGRKKTISTPGKLTDVAADMWRLKAYRRVYWSGAAFFLEADLALREQGESLSSVIASYTSCCLTEYSRGGALMRQLDRISQSNIFSSLYRKYSERTDFPVITMQQLNEVADLYRVAN